MEEMVAKSNSWSSNQSTSHTYTWRRWCAPCWSWP